jgi:predicted nicotinamide N-methyase
MGKHRFIEPRHIKRAKRVLAFGVASGIVSPGAGSWIGIDAVTSAIFGANLRW